MSSHYIINDKRHEALAVQTSRDKDVTYTDDIIILVNSETGRFAVVVQCRKYCKKTHTSNRNYMADTEKG